LLEVDEVHKREAVDQGTLFNSWMEKQRSTGVWGFISSSRRK